MRLWMKKEGKNESVTLTFFSIGFVFALIKLLFADMSFGVFTFGPFSGLDFAAVTGALGGVYALRKMGPQDDSSKPTE